MERTLSCGYRPGLGSQIICYQTLPFFFVDKMSRKRAAGGSVVVFVSPLGLRLELFWDEKDELGAKSV